MFRFAVMGAGNIAAHFCRAFSSDGDAGVCAVASKSMDRARAFSAAAPVPRAYDSYEEMLERETPDCVYIATTGNDHARLTSLCVHRGVSVICEKAMFLSSYEAEQCLTLARERHVFVMEAMWSRYLPALRRVKEWMDEGRIGRISLVEFSIGFSAPKDPENRYFSRKLGGGAMYDLTVYGYEILDFLFDGHLEMEWTKCIPTFTGVDGTDVVCLRCGDVPAVISTSLTCAVRERLSIAGEAGRIEVERPHCARKAELFLPD